MAPERQETCSKGHNDWAYYARGDRACRTCRNARRKQRRRNGTFKAWAGQKNQGDKGPRDDTFTREEIMRVRGYVQ